VDRGKSVQRGKLIEGSGLGQKLRFLIELPVANLFDFLL